MVPRVLECIFFFPNHSFWDWKHIDWRLVASVAASKLIIILPQFQEISSNTQGSRQLSWVAKELTLSWEKSCRNLHYEKFFPCEVLLCQNTMEKNSIVPPPRLFRHVVNAEISDVNAKKNASSVGLE